MIGFVVAAAFVAAAGTIAAARAVAGRAERKSVEGYERVLDTLRDASRRSEARAAIHPIAADEIGQPHVRAPGSDMAERFDDATGPVIAPRVPVSPFERLVFVDDSADAESEVEETVRPSRPAPPPSEELPTIAVPLQAVPTMHFDDESAATGGDLSPVGRGRRAGVGGSPSVRRTELRAAIAIVVAGALGVGGWQIASSLSGTPKPTAVSTPPVTQQRHHHSSTTTTTTPTSFAPSSVTTTEVDFQVPSGPLHISFSSVGACWLGVFLTPGAHPTYQWMDTLAANTSTSYDGTGKTYVRLGNPPAIAISVNGIPLELPSGNVAPYNLVLIPT